jgi:hypothetical protein
LRSLSRVIYTKDDINDAFCKGNTARPLLSFGPRGNKGGRQTFLYTEALKKFENEVTLMDLTEIYKKAKPVFTGGMERTFIVLKDDYEPGAEVVTGPNKEPVGSKRRPSSMSEAQVKRVALGNRV